MPYIIAEDALPIYYTDRGQGAPIFLIHGWPANHKFFQLDTPELSRTGGDHGEQ
jgi:pimeloyl-ACP methyl ester carboxylesterase